VAQGEGRRVDWTWGNRVLPGIKLAHITKPFAGGHRATSPRVRPGPQKQVDMAPACLKDRCTAGNWGGSKKKTGKCPVVCGGGLAGSVDDLHDVG